MQELKDSLANTEEKSIFELPGLLKYFISKRQEGMADKEIVKFLIGNENVPRNAIGAILRPEIEPIKDYGQWLDKNILKKS